MRPLRSHALYDLQEGEVVTLETLARVVAHIVLIGPASERILHDCESSIKNGFCREKRRLLQVFAMVVEVAGLVPLKIF